MSDTPVGDGWWQASDGKWYSPEQHPSRTQVAPAPQASAVAAPVAPAPGPAGGIALPPGTSLVDPWGRLGAWLLEVVLVIVTLGIGWLIWAAMTAGTGQTPAKKLLNQRVIDASSIRPVGMGKMFWMRWLLAGFVAGIAVPFTLGILLLMPFWDSRNQNLWDKISSTYVVSDPNDAWGTKPNLGG